MGWSNIESQSLNPARKASMEKGGRYKVLEPELTEEVIHVEGGG